MSAKVIKFPLEKPFNAVEHFGKVLSATKHDYSYVQTGDIDDQILGHAINYISTQMQDQNYALRYYFAKLLKYNKEEAAQVIAIYDIKEILFVLAAKYSANDWLAMERWHNKNS